MIYILFFLHYRDYKGTTGSDLYSTTNHSATYNRDSDNPVNLTTIDGGYHNMKPPEVSTPESQVSCYPIKGEIKGLTYSDG